ncbi:MAG: acetylxylan esterase [Cyclobacteriaceae bacterium]|nr:acetylxylan esterase [Cyclobacteriaceae bacterium]
MNRLNVRIPAATSTFLAIVLLLLFQNSRAQEGLLCRGHYWTEDQANLVMKDFAARWNDQASWEERAKVIRQGIIDGLQISKLNAVKGNFNPIISEPVKVNGYIETDGYIVENIAIESFPGFYITGNLYRPDSGSGKHPAILSPHGHWFDRRFSEEVQKRCATLARMGAIVFAYDMIGYGESLQVDHNISIALLLQTWNSKRVLEYLLSRPDVDPERIGMTGASGGATQTFVFAAIDDRIKVSVPAVQVSAHFFGGCSCESGMPIHKSKDHQTNNVEIAALMAPKPMLIISNGSDYTHNTPRIEYPYIQKVYALYNAEHKVENAHFPQQVHDYGYDKRVVMYNFFSQHLKLNHHAIPYENGFKEDFVNLGYKDDLSVFTDENPVPVNALEGNEEVIEYLKNNFGVDYQTITGK